MEARYWTSETFLGESRRRHASGVATPLDFSDVVWADPTLAGAPVDLFDGVLQHRVWRRSNFDSLELNLLRFHTPLGSGRQGFSADWLAGIRYLRFDENLRFGSLASGTWGADPTLEGYLEDDIRNSLWGLQAGCQVNYEIGWNWRLFATPKIGIYNNRIENQFRGYRGDGQLFSPNYAPGGNVPGTYPAYPVSSSTNVISFLTQIDAGLELKVTRHMSATFGYRVLVATGIGFADHQFTTYVVDTPEIADIGSNGDLILHGGYAGLTFYF